MSKTIKISSNNVTVLSTSITQGQTLGSGIRIPSGSTGSRPASPAIGTLRYNTDLARFEGWNGFFWAVLSISTDPTLPFQLPSYTVSELAALVAAAGSIAYCTDESGGSITAFYDGTNWRRTSDRAIVS